MSTKKKLLIVYHSQGGTMQRMAARIATGAGREEAIEVLLRPAAEASLDDLLACSGIAICSPEYFGTMAGMIKDFFDRTYEAAKDATCNLPFVIVVCAGNDGRGAISQIERLAASYRWRKVQEHRRIVGQPSEEGLADLEELGQTLAAGIDFGIF